MILLLLALRSPDRFLRTQSLIGAIASDHDLLADHIAVLIDDDHPLGRLGRRGRLAAERDVVIVVVPGGVVVIGGRRTVVAARGAAREERGDEEKSTGGKELGDANHGPKTSVAGFGRSGPRDREFLPIV